jgi:hypothetical protein
MYVPFLVGALLAAAAAPAAPGAAPDPCVQEAPADDAACSGLRLCSARERIRIACELRDAVQSRYVFLDAKPALLGREFDARARLHACVADERAILGELDPLRFYDRIRRCVASFEDGHLLVSAPDRLPEVALGLGLRRVGGKLVIASREPGFRQLAGDAVAAALPVGAEVVAVDGRTPLEAAEDLAREIPASSAPARLERAVEALTRRAFAYPERPTVALTLEAGGTRRTVEVPWWASPGAERHPAAAAWARRSGIRATGLLPWFEDAARPRPGAISEGTPRWAPMIAPADVAALREFADENGRVAVRLGVVSGRAGNLCYLQILSFHTETLSSPGSRRPFAAVIDDHIRECGERRLDLVLDLRRNEGGYLDHSTAVAEALAPAGTAQPGAALVLRATERNEAVYRERSAAAGGATVGGGAGASPIGPRRVLDAIGVARRDGRPFTPGFLTGPLGPRAAVGGYAGRVVALTGPACMSACDRLAGLLHASGRAVLVGGPTEGAGGSQQETPGVSARWTDSQRLLSVSIPNAAFGVPRTAAAAAGEVPFEKFFEAYGVENRPVEPDVRYEPGLEDVTESGRGWRERVDAILLRDGGVADDPARLRAGSAPRRPYAFAASSAFTFSITWNASAT